jgi:hypothetical protein
MKNKIIFVDAINNEFIVASFKTQIEAFQCASLLEALNTNEKCFYAVEFKLKGQTVRKLPQDIRKTIYGSSELYDYLKPIFNA